MRVSLTIGITVVRAAVISVVLALLCVAAVFGCAADASVSLVRSEFSLAVGESRDVRPYVTFSPATASDDIALSASSDCVAISGTTITAVTPGSAVVTVSAFGQEKELTVTVAYRRPNSITIGAENVVQTAGSSADIRPVRLWATMDEFADPNTEITWSVGDITHTGGEFEFTPRDYGEFVVTAAAAGLRETTTVGVYRKTDIDVRCDGALEQTELSAVVFSAYEKVDSRNPRSRYEWSVDGVSVCDRRVFEFTPRDAGEYKISLKANGRDIEILGKDCVTVSTVGAARQSEVAFDDCDGVFVRWNGGGVSFVSIIGPDGVRRNFDSTDAQYSHLFKPGEFRATEFITPCAEEPRRYKIVIGGEARCELYFTQLSAAAEEYLDNVVLCRNAFISSADDAMVFVRESYACGIKHTRCFSAIAADETVAAVQSAAAELGLTVSTRIVGDIVELELGDYTYIPQSYESIGSKTVYSSLPHIEYEQESRRSADYVFALDRARRSVEVSGSEQLLAVALEGVKPEPEKDSRASEIYAAAKSVLLRIIGADYSARQKVHAIYDWLQWVCVKSTTKDGSLASGYLEGIFIVPRVAGTGYAVTSGGFAKAFALMCAIEGIDCDILCDLDTGRVYNRVKLDGELYNVDVFGGKPSVDVSAEITSHRGLLVADGELGALGIHAADGEAYDRTNTYLHEKHIYTGEYFDYYIDASECDDADMLRAAVRFAYAGVKLGNTRIPYVSSEVQIYNSTFGVELALDPTLSEEKLEDIKNAVQKASDEYAAEVIGKAFLRQKITVIGNTVFVTADASVEVI